MENLIEEIESLGRSEKQAILHIQEIEILEASPSLTSFVQEIFINNIAMGENSFSAPESS
ncbi:MULTISPECIES: hypothetical protein [unclassified Thermosynechococcus]|uniref:hypothetical protein n=1 Tax=unclassified Thermosynechococcus TaxID=2622553 RepID=UPI0025D593F9|nr:hypothetical protein [Thermosynechococcus sp. M55_K2018_012]